MDRLIRIFRSRFFLGAFCILLEFSQLCVVFILLYEFFLPITILGWVFHVGILLHLINRDHRKITVIDGRVGFTGGVNLADEYINAVAKHGHWRDTAVRIEGSAVRNLTALFITSWNTQSSESIDCASYLSASTGFPQGRGYVIPFGDGPEPIYKDNIGKSVYKVLLEDGVKIYEYTPGFIHAKSFVCDDKYAVCGTINLDYRSLVHHFECGAWMYHTDCILDMKTDFLETAAQSQEIPGDRPVMRGWQRLLAETMKIFSPLF